MSRLAAGDPHPRTTRKPSSGFTSAAARLLLRHGGGREVANGESIEFFSALRKCLPDPQISGQNAAQGTAQPADGKGKARRGGSGGSADDVLSLTSGIGKHDYDWLLTPPGTPLWSPATSTSGDHQVSSAVPRRLAKAGSASYGKSNSRVSPTGIGEKETPKASRLSNCSSATSVNNAVPSSGRPLRIRISSASSINTASNASVSSTPLWSGGSSPRTPGTAGSPAAATAIAQTRRRDKPRLATSYVVVQSMAPASKPKSGAPSPTCTRARPAPGVSSPRSTASTSSRQPSLTRRADVATARSRLASQSGGTGSTPQPRDAHQTSRGRASGVASSRNGVRSSRQVTVAVEQGGVAAATPASTTTQRWRRSLAPAIAAARNVRRGNALDNGSPVYSAGQKINDDKARPHRTAAAASMGSGLTRTGSRKSANTAIVKRAVNENEDCRRRQDARHGGAGGAPDHRKPALLQGTRRSVTTRSRLGLVAAATSKSGWIASGHQHEAPGAAVAKVAGVVAFPSMRYDAMLLREDPKNLTWLRGCDEEGDGGSVGGIDLVDSSLELFDVATGLSRTAVRI
ncbi:hypothetical protein SEVIR_3G297500v4 [Setaria viridis]|uniref:Uncharacterized protein n=1 Tax=Setaria viridis TaxID=4556 RepID=A0A4V6DA31_SETVI|nr:uncharacterized protein LOC117849841 [Setaria viridis]TKW28036.1 hypothetical protein SEVIR_3G297500v2 [Setaria viridis]